MTLESIKGLGPKNLKLLNKLGINTIEDLVSFYPFRYDVIKRSNLNELEDQDKIIIDGSSFTIYKDYVYSKEKEYIKRRNDLLQKAIDDNNNDIPHDYIYIKNLFFEIDKNLDELIKEKNIHDMLKANEILNNLESLTLNLRANLMSNSINKVKGIWYYPFKTLDDTSLDGVLETINLLK